jgi:hypothetical protein
MKHNVLHVTSVANGSSYYLEAHINSEKRTHTQRIQIYNIQKVVEFFIKQNLKTEKCAITNEGAFSFLAVKHYIGGNYSLHSILFFHSKNSGRPNNSQDSRSPPPLPRF